MAFAVALLVVVEGYLSVGPVAQLKAKTGRSLPESHLYSAKTLRDFVAAAGAPAYRSQLRWDVAFALVYGVGLEVLLDGALGRALHSPARFRLLVLIPAVAVLADLLEDACLYRLATRTIETCPWTRSPGLLAASRIATAMKFAFVCLSVLLIAVGAILLSVYGPFGVG